VVQSGPRTPVPDPGQTLIIRARERSRNGGATVRSRDFSIRKPMTALETFARDPHSKTKGTIAPAGGWSVHRSHSIRKIYQSFALLTSSSWFRGERFAAPGSGIFVITACPVRLV
jgi:hypothetical protein